MLDSVQQAYIGGTIAMNLINVGIAIFGTILLKRIAFTHTNLKTIALFWIIAYLSQNTGQIAFMITLLVTQDVVLSSDFNVGTVARYFIFFGIFLVRFLLIFTSVERIIATVWLDTYEKKQRVTLFSVAFGSSLVKLNYLK